MFDKLKMKFAARRVKAKKKDTKKKTSRKNTKRNGFWARAWNIICWPFRMIAKLCKRFWNWLCGINLVAMVNLALLVAIIVLFTMLIINIVGCRGKQPIVIMSEPVPVTQQVSISENSAPIEATQPTLPVKRDASTRKMVARPVNVVPVKKYDAQIAKQQIARQNDKFYGDVIIDSRASGAMLTHGAKVQGNLYIQNMRKYTLPCDIRINGNLFLRDVNMLQFCGDFVITGNIYVSPRSSFGPIPATARLGGQVVL